MFVRSKEIKNRLKDLENHLQNESPLLVNAVHGFKELDQVASKIGLISNNDSYSKQVSWWPIISVLGTNSTDKVEFLNSYLNYSTDDANHTEDEKKFTVLCYSNGKQSRILPGIALDADPRFPFYQITNELKKIPQKDSPDVNGCLKLLTCPSEQLQGYIFIDTPGFDTEIKCIATSKLTDHVIDMSDLVLMFIDTNQTDRTAMQDRLEHLLTNTNQQKHSGKFIYILNQPVNVSDEEAENILSAWQNILTQENFSSGTIIFLSENEKANSSEEIIDRIQQIYTDRTYRILGNLDRLTRDLEQNSIPKLSKMVRRWERGVIWRDILSFTLLTTAVAVSAFFGGAFEHKEGLLPWFKTLFVNTGYNLWHSIAAITVLFLVLFLTHLRMRKASLNAILEEINEDFTEKNKQSLTNALIKNTSFSHSIFRPNLVGWNYITRKKLRNVLKRADQSIQNLNDRYAKPSGDS